MKLSPYQRRAVDAPPGGVFVAAAAGSGKTRVLTERFVRLVLERDSADGGERAADALASVIAVTFTEKAAGELSERIRGSFARRGELWHARRADEAWVSTIHGLCARILRRHAFEAGLDPRFSVADDVHSGILRQEAFERAVRELAGDVDVGELIGNYDVVQLADCCREVDEQLRALDLAPADLGFRSGELSAALAEARASLGQVLLEMEAVDGRGPAEDANIAAVRSLIGQIDAVRATGRPDALAVAEALTGFKVSKACRECAKPLARRADEVVAELKTAAADAVAEGHQAAFARVLDRYRAHYEALKDARGVLDFEDLQVRSRDLLRAEPRIASAFGEQLQEVMIDEFQDTNELQVSVAQALIGETFTTVGDEKQSIYGWRNADVEVFRERAHRVPEESHFGLPENFRSHPELLRFFNELFSGEPFWPGDFLELEAGERGEGQPAARDEWFEGAPRIQVTLVDRAACGDAGPLAAEAAEVAAHFAELADAGVSQQHMVLLLGAMTHVDAYESALRARGLDVFVGSGGTYFDTPEAEELEALLRVVANSADDEALARVLVGRMVALPDDSLFALAQSAGRGRTLWDAAADAVAEDGELLGEDERSILAQAVGAIEWLRAHQDSLSLYDLVHEACGRFDYDLALFASGKARAWGNVVKFARLAEEFEQTSAGDPAAFLEYLRHRKAHKRHEQQAVTAAEGVQAVRIMTVHGAKGLEFPVVAVAGLGSRPRDDHSPFIVGQPRAVPLLGVRLPDAPPFDAEGRTTSGYASVRDWAERRALAEAKRVFYVACTRASQALALFGVVDLGKPAEAMTPIGWVRTALGTEHAQREGGVAHIGGETVSVAIGPTKQAAAASQPLTPDKSSVWTQEGDECASAAKTDAADPDQPEGALGEVEGGARPRRISYTGLETYRTCPRKYYATYVARVGSLAKPAGADSAMAVGVAVHEALRQSAGGSSPSAARMQAIARQASLSDAGLKRVHATVEAYLASDLAKRAESSASSRREVPFGVAVGQTVLDGSIDLLACDGERALVVDYKTGTSAPDSRTLEHWRFQSACYALAVLRSGSGSVEVAFVQPEVAGAVTTFEYSAQDAEAIEREVDGLLSEMAEGRFEPLAEYARQSCDECPAARVLCSVRKPGPGGAA